MHRNTTIGAMAAALAIGVLAPAMASDTTTTISGTIGERVDDDGSYIRMRHVGEPSPDGYDGNYQKQDPFILTTSPEDGPVTMTGTLDLTDMGLGVGGIVGLYDAETLRTGGDAHQTDNGIYVARSSRGFRIGVSDGNVGGGEIVQAFADFPTDLAQPVEVELTIDGTADPSTCASNGDDIATADGCMTLVINGTTTVTDSYGTLSDQTVELATGANPGWWAFGFGEAQAFTSGAGVDYELTISPTILTAPRDAGDCRDGGFDAFDFKNQGQCVASVQANENAGK